MTAGPILAIDQGTTNTKVLLIDDDATVVVSVSRPVQRTYPRPGWVEQDATQLWASVDDAVQEVLSRAPAGGVAAIAVTNQRESMIAWDRRSGQPVGPCISWQCRRTADVCSELRARGFAAEVAERTGLPLDPLFSAAKASWLLGQGEDLRRRADLGEVCVGTVDSWLVWQLTGGVHSIEVGNASRTQLLNLRTAAWDERLLDLFAVPIAVLPAVRPSVGHHGSTVARGGLGAGIPILAIAADSHAALYGHGCFAPGDVKATYGTGSSIMSPTVNLTPSGRGAATSIAWQDDVIVYAREANITASGATIDWLAGVLGCSSADEVAALAGGVDDAGGVHIVPAFAGLGAPHWDDAARGSITGLTFGSTRRHLARAAIESIAFQVRDVVESLQGDEVAVDGPLHADGGATRNAALMQFQADVLGRPVLVSGSVDLSALGVAALAGGQLGLWDPHRVVTGMDRVQTFEPRMSEDERETRYANWSAAVARVLDPDPRAATHQQPPRVMTAGSDTSHEPAAEAMT